MPEYTYIPGEGAVETRGGVPLQQPTTSDNAFVEEKGFGTLEEYQDHQLNQTARGLGRRESISQQTRGTSHEDIDKGTYNTEVAALEHKLQAKQAQLYSCTDPTKVVQLAEECEALADQIVNGRATALNTPSPFDEQGNTIEDQIRGDLGERADEILQHASEVLPAETIQELNDEVLTDADPLVKKAGFKTLEQLQQHPEAFHSNREEWQPLNDDQVSQLTDAFGAQRSREIQAISYAVATGKTTPAQALKLAAKDPGLLNALVQGAARGIYQVMI